jgi:hypothetical protein
MKAPTQANGQTSATSNGTVIEGETSHDGEWSTLEGRHTAVNDEFRT